MEKSKRVAQFAHESRAHFQTEWVGEVCPEFAVPESIAIIGANYYVKELDPNEYVQDAPDDIYCIKLGRRYAKSMNWQSEYSILRKINNLFRNE